MTETNREPLPILALSITVPEHYPTEIPQHVLREFERIHRAVWEEMDGSDNSVAEFHQLLHHAMQYVAQRNTTLIAKRQKNFPNGPSPDTLEGPLKQNFWEDVKNFLQMNVLPEWRSARHMPPASETLESGTLARQIPIAEAGERYNLREIDTQEAVKRTRRIMDPKNAPKPSEPQNGD